MDQVYRYFKIGGHRLVVCSGSEPHLMESLEGFRGFRVTSSGNVRDILTLYTGPHLEIGHSESGIRLLHQFELEHTCCRFSETPETYLLQIRPGGEELFLEISKRPPFRAYTNVYDVRKHLLYIRYVLWMAYGLSVLPEATFSLHASAVVKNEKAILFLGDSGTGKSTHARLWKKHIPGCHILNDDCPIVRLEENIPWAYGSPWSGKTPVYSTEKVRIGALVKLRQAPENSINLQTGLSALGSVVPAFPGIFFYERLLSEHAYTWISGLFSGVPLYQLDCLPEASAAELVYKTLYEAGIL